MNKSSLSSRLANFLSSAFLALALLMAVGFAVHSMSMTEATAKADMNTDIVATDDLEIEGNDVPPPPLCGGLDLNCYEEIVIKP